MIQKFKLYTILLGMIIIAMLSSCEDVNENIEEGNDQSAYILCEGNFGYATASLWTLSEDMMQLDGPLHWTLGSDSENPLGDVGQSLHIDNDRLYIVMNNSHRIEMMDISGNVIDYYDGFDLPNASPRDIEVKGDIGFISSWNYNAILVYDLNSLATLDTVFLGDLRQPEQLLLMGNYLYASVKQHSDGSSANNLMRYFIEGNSLVLDTIFMVCEGAGNMLLNDNKLYIAGSYYDTDWNKYATQSVVNLFTEQIISKDYGQVSNSTADLFIYKDEMYRNYENSYQKLDNELNLIKNSNTPELPGLYTITAIDDYIIAGTTDYAADNKIHIIDENGNILRSLQTGALPGEILGK